MKILLIEDTAYHIENFSKQLSLLGEVTVFKSSNGARNWLRQNKPQLDLVVCDHYVLRFEAEPKTQATGDEVYQELRWGGDYPTVPFIHFSSDPCPEEYKIDKEVDTNFYSIKKTTHVDLVKFIEEKGLKK